MSRIPIRQAKLAFFLVFLVGIMLFFQSADNMLAQAQDVDATNRIFLPLVAREYMPLATRIGYGADPTHPITRYSDINLLHAGWYLNWTVGTSARPAGIEFAQVVFIHQKLSCGLVHHADRKVCPYAQPYDYIQSPNNATIAAVASARPGQIWLIGNETDRVDWQYCKSPEPDGSCLPANIGYNGQGEMIPETYAKAYHDLYAVIKSADPTAKVAIGGVIQATPLRLQYLSLIWDNYQSLYGTPLPTDLWNIHNFVLREQVGGYGAEIPPGLPGNPQTGAYTDNDCTHLDMNVFDSQIRAFRQWMKDRNQQEKPLLITEYGVLYSHQVNQPNCQVNFSDPQLVHNFMINSFDYFLNTKDCALGYSADSCRLVQRWLWFSLDHSFEKQDGTFAHTHANGYSSLFDRTTLNITEAGQLFRSYVMQHFNDLRTLPQ